MKPNFFSEKRKLPIFKYMILKINTPYLKTGATGLLSPTAR